MKDKILVRLFYLSLTVYHHQYVWCYSVYYINSVYQHLYGWFNERQRWVDCTRLRWHIRLIQLLINKTTNEIVSTNLDLGSVDLNDDTSCAALMMCYVSRPEFQTTEGRVTSHDDESWLISCPAISQVEHVDCWHLTPRQYPCLLNMCFHNLKCICVSLHIWDDS